MNTTTLMRKYSDIINEIQKLDELSTGLKDKVTNQRRDNVDQTNQERVSANRDLNDRHRHNREAESNPKLTKSSPEDMARAATKVGTTTGDYHIAKQKAHRNQLLRNKVG